MLKDKYVYIPAGVSADKMGITIYVKYKTNPREIVLKSSSTNHIHVSAPDRDLWITSGAVETPPRMPKMDDYDEIVHPSPLWPHKDPGHNEVNAYMMNYTTYMGAKGKRSPSLRKEGKHPNVDQTIFSDSGGYQLLTGRLDFLNPIDIVHWYNDNVDLGMVLDVPMGGTWWEGCIAKQAEAQAMGTEHMMRHKEDRLELINILHGGTIQQYEEYRSIVERDDIHRMSIGGLYFHSLLKSAYNTMCVLLRGQKYKHYHVLGYTHPKEIYPLMRMAAKGLAPLITSDGTNYSLEARMKRMMLWPTIDSKPVHRRIGIETQGIKVNKATGKKLLPCSCPVCTTIKYTDILAEIDGGLTATLLTYHNMFGVINFTQTMNEIVSEASLQDLKDLLRHQFPPTRNKWFSEMIACLEFVDFVAENGIDKAQSFGKSQFFLGNLRTQGKIVDGKRQIVSYTLPALTSNIPFSDEENDLEALNINEVDMENRVALVEPEENEEQLANPVRYDKYGMYDPSIFIDEKNIKRKRLNRIFDYLLGGPKRWASSNLEELNTKELTDDNIATSINAGAKGTIRPGKKPKTAFDNRKVRKKRGIVKTEKVEKITKARKEERKAQIRRNEKLSHDL